MTISTRLFRRLRPRRRICHPKAMACDNLRKMLPKCPRTKGRGGIPGNLIFFLVIFVLSGDWIGEGIGVYCGVGLVHNVGSIHCVYSFCHGSTNAAELCGVGLFVMRVLKYKARVHGFPKTTTGRGPRAYPFPGIQPRYSVETPNSNKDGMLFVALPLRQNGQYF